MFIVVRKPGHACLEEVIERAQLVNGFLPFQVGLEVEFSVLLISVSSESRTITDHLSHVVDGTALQDFIQVSVL